MSGPFQPTEILRTLLRHEVRFVVVGGVAATLAGSPLTTKDLDLVYDVETGNLDRLTDALREINAHYRDPAGRHIVPDVEKLESIKVNLLLTDLGPLDLLREVGEGLDFDALDGRVIEYEIEEHRILAIDVETLIETKEAAGRPKDFLALPFLRSLAGSDNET